MTYDTLVFIRNVLCQLSLKVGEPDFRTTAPKMIDALDELDKEIANAGTSSGCDLPSPLTP
jgi:hypothetical protein